MATRTRRCKNALQRLWATLCQTGEETTAGAAIYTTQSRRIVHLSSDNKLNNIRLQTLVLEPAVFRDPPGHRCLYDYSPGYCIYVFDPMYDDDLRPYLYYSAASFLQQQSVCYYTPISTMFFIYFSFILLVRYSSTYGLYIPHYFLPGEKGHGMTDIGIIRRFSSCSPYMAKLIFLFIVGGED